MSQKQSDLRPSCVRGFRPSTSCLVAPVAWLALAAGVFGQDDSARFSSWQKVEAASETKAYREAMTGGGAFDQTARGFLEQIALPQLQLESNRSTIERIRKRLREYLLGGIANEKTADEATKTVASFMESLAAKNDVDPAVRVNAMLLIGELQSTDKKPWQPAAAMLAQAVSNTNLLKAVRIAACVGLARHVEATKGVVEEQQRVAALAVPAIQAVLKEPTTPETVVENDWMASRCLAMLPLLGLMKPATAEEVVRILDDASRSINVRVRAAAALAAAGGPESKVDATALIKAIGGLATASLELDVATADKRLLDRQYGGGAGQPLPGVTGFDSQDDFGGGGVPANLPSQPAVAQLIPKEVCRRAAWRLSVLADAILTEDSKRGLALLMGDIPPAIKSLSVNLRRWASVLDERPQDAILRQALASLTAADAQGQKP